MSGIAQRRNIRLLVCLAVISLVVVFDQATKAVIRTSIPVGESRPFIDGLLRLTHIENGGAAFGLGQGGSVVFAIIALAVLVFVIFLVWHEELPISVVCFLSFVAGGGLGNMIDRITKCTVTDFFETTFMNFPIFNVADIFVTVGVILAFITYSVWDARRSRKAQEAPEAEVECESKVEAQPEVESRLDIEGQPEVEAENDPEGKEARPRSGGADAR